MDPKLLAIVDQINILIVFVFVVLVILAVVRIGYRYLEYKKYDLDVPDLLPRDFFLFLGLAIPFLGVLIFRATGIMAREHWWYPFWSLGTGLMAIVGVAYWVWYEYIKVEKNNKK
jgi:hypothetical protein